MTTVDDGSVMRREIAATPTGRSGCRPCRGAFAGVAVACVVAAMLGSAMLAWAPPAHAWGLLYLSFVDQTHGWAVGTNADPPKDGLLRTTDGGATWKVQKSTVAFNGTGFDVQFVSRSRGIWVNSYIYSTFNGGLSWRKCSIPGDWGYGSFVDFATPSVVWVAGTYGSDGFGRCVARSTNGGRTWKNRLSVTTSAGRMPTGLSAPSASTAYIWDRGLIVTRNGGATWRRVKTSYGFKRDAWWAIDFPATKVGWALRRDTASFVRTRDGGKRWARQMPGLVQHLTDMDFIDKDHGWVVGAAGSVYRTVDGGANWSFQQVPTSAGLTFVDFVDARHGWVSTDSDWGKRNAVYRTTDGGDTWTQVR